MDLLGTTRCIQMLHYLLIPRLVLIEGLYRFKTFNYFLYFGYFLDILIKCTDQKYLLLVHCLFCTANY